MPTSAASNAGSTANQNRTSSGGVMGGVSTSAGAAASAANRASATRSGAGGGGGVRNTSSGQRESAGSRSTSGGPGGSQNQGGQRSGGSPGGSQNQGSQSNMGRGDTPSSGKSTGSTLGGRQGGATPAARAATQRARDTANAMAQRGLLGGRTDTSGTGLGGLLSGSQKQNANYGLGTFQTTPAQNFVDVFSKQNRPLGYNMNIDPAFAESLFQAVHDAHKKGMWQDTIFNDGLRSYEVQQGIRDRALRQGFPGAPPGLSMHQYGLAVDLAGARAPGTISNYVRSNLDEYGLEPAVPHKPGFDYPHVQLAGTYANRQALRAERPMATNANMGPSYSAPSLQDAVSRPSVDPRGLMANVAEPKDLEMAAAVAARNVLAGLGNNPGRSFPGAPSPSMNMADYQSPMASVDGMPPARGSMTAIPGNSPMALARGVPRELSPSFPRSRSPAPEGPFAAIGGPEPVGQQQLRNAISGMSFNPGLPGQMQQPNMDMRGYNSPMANVGNLPTAPQSAGMSFNPGMPRNPISGMSFNPSQPGQMPSEPRSRSPFASGPHMDMSGYRSPMGFDPSGMPRAPSDPSGGMSFTPGLPGPMSEPQVARHDRPRALGLENYNPPSPTQVAEAPGGPMDIRPREPANYPQPYMGSTYDFSVPGRPAGTKRSVAPTDRITESILTGALGQATGVPGFGMALDGLQELGALGRQGRLGNRPGQPYANGMDHSGTYAGGSDAQNEAHVLRGSGPNGEWNGQESPSQVAQMQQNVEQVLRGYFVQIPGQQYPQYTTGYFPAEGTA